MTTTVINIKTGAAYDVYIGRANAAYGLPQSKWHNPFKLTREEDRARAVSRYRIWLLQQPRLLESLGELRGAVLGCWCKDRACHGDVLAELANSAEANGQQLRPASPAPWALESSDVRTYWAVEVALGSVALERLQRICVAHGYSYDATVEALGVAESARLAERRAGRG